MPTIRIRPRSYKSETSSSSTSVSSSFTTSRERPVYGFDDEGYEESEDETVPVSAADKSRRPIAGSKRVLDSMIRRASADGQPLHSFNPQPIMSGPAFRDNGSSQQINPPAAAPVASTFGFNPNGQDNNMEYAMDVDMDVTMEDVSHS